MVKRHEVAEAVLGGALARSSDEGAGRGADDEALGRHFEAFGLNGYEARGLVALVALGSGTAEQLARRSGITRTNVYRVLDELQLRGLATPVAGKSTHWAVAAPDEVLAALHQVQLARMRELETRMVDARRLMDTVGSEAGTSAIAHVRLLRSGAEATRAYQRLLDEVRTELVMFTRSPFLETGKPSPAVLAARARGVAMRVLYQEPDLAAPGAEVWRRELDAYHAAGVEARVVDELPIKLSVFDSVSALVALPDPPLPGASYPTMTLVEHPGYAGVMVRAFESYWAEGRPYEPDDSAAAQTSQSVSAR
ncbi:MAG TPA: helix-turn-helix domain-containing protein [Acidimicrobiales bacterium]|nr:helix-turn-helix domain-containing protein [Acidimicrobiales bacterium]